MLFRPAVLHTWQYIQPKLRSKLQSIQLLCIVKDVFVQQYGIDAILSPFVEEIKLLEDVSGIKKAIGVQILEYTGVSSG